MKTLVVFYSYSGHTRAKACELEEAATEIKDVQRPGKMKAYTLGCLAAIRGRAWPIEPLPVDFADFDKFILLSPVWASNAPPAVNAFLEQLPEGKTVAVIMVSGGGKSGCREKLEARIKAKGCMLEDFEDIKA